MLFKGEPYNEDNAAKLDEALGWLNTFLEGRAFVAGDNLTVADITIVVTISNIDVNIYLKMNLRLLSPFQIIEESHRKCKDNPKRISLDHSIFMIFY